MNYSYLELEKALRGKLVTPTRRKRFEGELCLDTRTIKKGDMFVPLKGVNFDGHNFIAEAFAKGARVCLAEHSSDWKVRRLDGDVIYVDDCLQALGRLAAFHRRKHDIPVIAITGSCGKTTTKDLMAHLLSKQFKVLKNEGTENNSIGVPKALLGLADHDIAVIEVGTNQKGEIRHLSRIVNPTHAVLTLIGNAHLTGFRNVEGVRAEKLSMIEALEDGAIAIVNGEDKNIDHERLKKIKCIRVGFAPRRNAFYADEIELHEGGLSFRLNGKTKIRANLLGRHNVLNILLAIAAATEVGLKLGSVKGMVESFVPAKGRVRYQEVGGVYWIDDSYNSNPTSLRAAIELFKSYPPRGRKILVLGDMLELGEKADMFHREAGEAIAAHPFDLVLTVGDLSKQIADGAIAGGFRKAKIKSFASSAEAGIWLKTELEKNDTVLLKGSRGMRMEKVLEACAEGSAG